MDVTFFIFLSMAMFVIGIVGVLFKRNILIFILSIEMMLNAGNLAFVAFSKTWGDQTGLLWVFFILVVAAAEAAIGLAIVINQFRNRQVVDIDQYDELKG